MSTEEISEARRRVGGGLSLGSSKGGGAAALVVVDVLQDLYPGQLVEYKHAVLRGSGAVPPGAALVNFPLEPKPHEVAEEAWMKEHWV